MSVRLAEYSSFCETCATCLEHLWKDNLNVDIRFLRFKTLQLVREDARRGCELCKAITASVRLQDPYFNQFGEIPLQIYMPPAKAWNSYRFIHLNWRPDDVWETLPMVGMHEKYKYRISQVLHPFGEQGAYVHHVQILAETQFRWHFSFTELDALTVFQKSLQHCWQNRKKLLSAQERTLPFAKA